jgi:hypothetical protein
VRFHFTVLKPPAETLEELALGVLHLLLRLGIAAPPGHAFQGSQRESIAQVLSWLRQGQQRLQWI